MKTRKVRCKLKCVLRKYTPKTVQIVSLSDSLYNVPVKSKLQHPPPPPQAYEAFSCPGGREFSHHSQEVGNLIASLDVMLRDKYGRDGKL